MLPTMTLGTTTFLKDDDEAEVNAEQGIVRILKRHP